MSTSTETSEVEVGGAKAPWSVPYWEGLKERELRYQHCNNCQREVFPARKICPFCAAQDFEWRVSEGKGSIYSFSVLQLGAISRFADQVPYAITIVSLDEGFRMTSRIENADFSTLACDQRVEVNFDVLHGGLPSFSPSASE